MGKIKIEYQEGHYKVSFKQGKHYEVKYKISNNDFFGVDSACVDILRYSLGEMSRLGLVKLKIQYKWTEKGYTYCFDDVRLSFGGDTTKVYNFYCKGCGVGSYFPFPTWVMKQSSCVSGYCDTCTSKMK